MKDLWNCCFEGQCHRFRRFIAASESILNHVN